LIAQANDSKGNVTGQVLTEQGIANAAVGVWGSLLRGHAGIARELSASLQAEHGLTINDYEALLLLSKADDNALRRIDLAGRLVLTASGVTRLLDGLERSGLVAKQDCETDARVTYAVLTEAGRAKLGQAACSHVAHIRQLLEERYSCAELETLTELLSRLPGAAEPVSCTPAP
jgi:DNA-binding MarR family transcriptional regulator